ncbi:major facilitator superfamily domain-containing protein [Clohesyomyces aquaticus]|uniref:Major facilitator superfamily domain-containing protein n=1 Tax=Clohesyomyces aquaticus TaxID=1231657 RepID=A0A1Y1ZKH9_9PLEO|nr:major facilitator superfamily domain-containing protein [Clohesyomyces aquaticus]
MSEKLQSRPAPSQESEPQKDIVYLTGLPLFLLFFALCLSSFLIVLYMSVITTAVPSITTYFGTVEDVDWYVTAYLLALCSVQPLTGQIYNNFRIKFTFVSFIAMFVLGSLISALSKRSITFIIGRAFAGVGAAGMFNGSMVIITATTAPNLRPQLMSISVSLILVGGLVGPVIGGAIAQHLGWRWCKTGLWIFLPPGALIAITILLQPIREHVKKPKAAFVARNVHHKFDLIGFGLFVPTCVMFMLATSWGGSKLAWNSATVIGLLCGSLAAACLFGWWTRYHGERAMIPLSIITNPVVMYATFFSLLEGGSFMMNQYYLPLWFQSVKRASPQQSGIMMLPTCISQLLSAICCTLLLRVVPYAPVWGLVGNIAVAIGSGLLTTLTSSATAAQWIGYPILNGIGRGMALQMPVLAVQAVLPSTEIAYATAIILLFQYFGGAVANCIAKTVFINALSPALRKYAPGVDVLRVIQAGATEVFELVDAKDVDGVVKAYNEALTLTFVS